MAYNEQFLFYVVNPDTGDYYSAEQQKDGSYIVDQTTSSNPGPGIGGDRLFLKDAPIGWEKTAIAWQRDSKYWGTIRSSSLIDGGYQFVKDGRGILQSLFKASGMKARARFQVYLLQETESSPGANDFWRYEKILDLPFDFLQYNDDIQDEKLQITLRKGDLLNYIDSRADTSFRVPFYTWDSGTSTWVPNCDFLRMQGTKVLYRMDFTAKATPSSPLDYTGGRKLLSFHLGQATGSSGLRGKFTFPSMIRQTLTMNNGQTTYIGNTVLENLITYDRGQDEQLNFIDFKNFTGDSFCLKDYVISPHMSVRVAAAFTGNITYSNHNPASGYNNSLSFVLWEVGSDDMAPQWTEHTVGTAWKPIYLYDVPLPWDHTASEGAPVTIAAPPPFDVIISASATSIWRPPTAPIVLNPDKVYAFGLLCDIEISGYSVECQFSKLECSILSNYNNGASAPIDAPQLPGQTVPAFRLQYLFNKIIQNLPTNRSDLYGFPIPVTTSFAGVSDFLSDPAIDPATTYDVVPQQMLITSDYALHRLLGQGYVNMSLNDLYSFCQKALGCGMTVTDTEARIEPLSHFFQDVLMLDLGTNVAKFEIKAIDNLIETYIEAGYNATSTNANFGVDEFSQSITYDMPTINYDPKRLDLKETGFCVGMYDIEIKRAQAMTVQSDNAYQTGTPAGDNQCIAVMGTRDYYIYDTPVQLPDGTTANVDAYGIRQYPLAQNYDPSGTGLGTPYINGLYYPDTAFNYEISPKRNLLRSGAYLHSLCDKMDGDYLTFRKITQIQPNNTVLEKPGISSNLYSGVISETDDVLISSLPTKLFRPIMLTIETGSLVNLYPYIDANPNGYVQFTWVNRYTGESEIWKGYLWSAEENVGDKRATRFELLCHPSITYI